MNEHDDARTATDPWEDEMSSELDRRVRDLQEAPLTFEQVRGRATRIRRRRRATAAGVVLATAAAVVPVALLATGDGTSDSRRVDPVAPQREEPAELAPTYVEGDVLRLPDGSAYDLPSAAYAGAVLLGDRVLAERRVEGEVSVDVVEDGEVSDTVASLSGLVPSAAGDVVALLDTDGAVRVFWADGERVLAEGYAGWSIQGVTGGADCSAEPSPCRVLLRDQQGTDAPVVVDGSAEAATPLPEVLEIADVSGTRYAATTSQSDDGNCGGVFDVAGGTTAEVFATCEHTLVQFSADGASLLAFPAYLSGFGPSSVSILDAATGEMVVEFAPGRDLGLGRTTWVDDDTVAFTLFDFREQAWSLLTLSAGDTGPVVVAGPVPGAEDAPAFRIIGR